MGYEHGDRSLVMLGESRELPFEEREHGMVPRSVECGVWSEITIMGRFCGRTILTPHDQGAQCRGEGESIEQRNTHGDGHGETELCIEGACDTADETDGYENGHEHKCGGDKGRGNIVHGLLCK